MLVFHRLKTYKQKLNAILKIVQTFGPQRAIDPKVRVIKKYSYLTKNEIDNLLDTCKEIEIKAYQIACEVRDGSKTFETFEQEMKVLFPGLTNNRLSTAISQAMYFSSR
jgi:hypothetical protein